MDEVLFTNIRLKRDTRYFIYVGELKAYPLNAYLRETLSRLYHTAVDFLAIIPDVLARYDTPNVMVINPVAQKLAGTIGKPVNLLKGFGKTSPRFWFINLKVCPN